MTGTAAAPHPDGQEPLPDFPGFLRTLKGAYISLDDFLAFIGRAARLQGFSGDDAARRWLAAHRLPASPDALDPARVSRALYIAHRVILEREGSANGADRTRHAAPSRPWPGTPGACPACGGTRFWIHARGGAPKCARCHPAPSPRAIGREFDATEDPHGRRRKPPP